MVFAAFFNSKVLDSLIDKLQSCERRRTVSSEICRVIVIWMQKRVGQQRLAVKSDKYSYNIVSRIWSERETGFFL